MSKKHNDKVEKQFTRTAEAFSEFAVRDSAEVTAEKVQFARPQPDTTALDVACGPGAFVLALAPKVQFVCGIDLTAEMLRRARAHQIERGIANACFERGDAEQLPYADISFDLVSTQCSIHHMPKPELVLREMVRVMKPEGHMLVIDPLGPESDAKFELHNRIEIIRDPSHTASLRLTTYLALFDKLGLEIVSQGVRRRHRSFNRWMLRAGLEPGDKRYQDARRLLEDSADGDRAGFSPQFQEDDIQIIHNEGMFLLTRRAGD
ncbi:MAG: class I SAM-dependent methyltransferase [Acidobacteria bacterium]|nr:class I SAM-dependent methyltransferase [Acidobacteriota bacterium]